MYRKHFPFFDKKHDGKDIVYFDASCTYIKNRTTIDEIHSYYTDFSCCAGDREASFLGSQLLNKIEKTRIKTCQFIGAENKDFIVFTKGTTDSINLLVSSLDYSKIRTIIVSDIEHNSNFLPQLQFSQEKQIQFNILPYGDFLDLEILDKKLSHITEPFVLFLTHLSNITGTYFNIKEIAKIAHKYGGYIFIDDAQYIPHHMENVKENGIDFLAFSGHKMGGPTGTGVLYISKICEDLIVYSGRIGGGTIKDMKLGSPNFKSLPYFLEGGVQDFAGIFGFGGCLNFYQSIGIGNIEQYIRSLSLYFLKKLEDSNTLELFTLMSDKNSDIITLIPKKFKVIDFHQYCSFSQTNISIAFRTGTMCADTFINTYVHTKNIMRVSFGIYNTFEDIDIFFYILQDFLKKSSLK